LSTKTRYLGEVVVVYPNKGYNDLMGSQTTHPIKFKYSRAVKKGRVNKFKGRESDRQKGELFNDWKGSGLRVATTTMVDDGILQSGISKYRHWFSFLKMALEMQQQEAVLIYKKKEHKIKVNESMYVGWDLDKVLTSKFDDWFFKQNHRTLFLTDITRILKSKEKASNNENKITIEFDAHRRITDIIKDIRRLNEQEDIFKNDDYKSDFVINGRVIDSVLQNRFNALFLKIEDKLTNKEILTHKNEYIRASSKSKEFDGIRHGYSSQLQEKGILDTTELDKDYSAEHGKDYELVSDAERRMLEAESLDRVVKHESADGLSTNVKEPNWAYTIHELMNGSSKTTGSKEILLAVCDGHFLKNPNNTYT